MKKKMNLKNFIMKKKVAAGCVAAAVIIAAGSFAVLQNPSDIPELTDYTDPVIETTLTGDDTPLASAPKVTTKTSTSSKTSKKTVKLKKAATKTYTKKLPVQTKKSTSTSKKNSTTTVKTEKTIKTAVTEKYTKKSKKKLVTTKVTTTVKTTTTVVQNIASASSEETSGAGSSNSSTSASKTNTSSGTASKSKYTISNVATIAPKMDSRVLNAYNKMGFSVIVDPKVTYAGYFSAKNRTITLQEADDTIYHELGHFLAFIAGNVDQSSEFQTIYNNEKSKYAGANKSYATQSSSEYFAECVRDYINNPSLLRSKCPDTYTSIEKALAKITDARINMIMKVYASVWK